MTKEAIISIPHYVLLNDDESPYGPRCRRYADKACTAVYGFTTQDAYEAFSGGAAERRRPYPLVSGYLTRVISQAGLQLIVIDAMGPAEASLEAVTADAALVANRNASEPAAGCYRLSLVPGAEEYHVERLS